MCDNDSMYLSGPLYLYVKGKGLVVVSLGCLVCGIGLPKIVVGPACGPAFITCA